MNIRIMGMALLLAALLQPANCAGPPARRTGVSLPPAGEGMSSIGQGTFVMGTDEAEINEKPEHDVFVSSYHVDLYEVTAAEFAAFLNARGNDEERYFTENGRSTLARGDDGIWRPRAGFENYPANNVSWHGAYGYCDWVDKRLPTESEWEKAARGEDKRRFPWGDDPPVETKARFGKNPRGDLAEILEPVDALPDGVSPYGLHHTSGNVWEWVSDWYRQHYCDWCDDEQGNRAAASILGAERAPFEEGWTEKQEALERVDPAGPAYGSFKVLRGGSWIDDGDELRTTVRYWRLPEDREINIGFRCASDPKQ